jgi:transposase
MKRKRHKPDEIIRKLREAEAMEAQGTSRAEILQRLGVSDATLGRWRQEFRGMGDDQIRRLKELELENRRLRKAVADLTLDKQIIEEVMRGKG